MNESANKRSSRGWPIQFGLKGQSMTEMALAAPVLMLLFVIVADFARAFYRYIEVTNAARAGAQYGSQTVITAADINGMIAAAKKDGTDVTGLTATASLCTCPTCPASYCAVDSKASFVEVDTSASFSTLLKYPGLPSSLTLSGKAIMEVQQ